MVSVHKLYQCCPALNSSLTCATHSGARVRWCAAGRASLARARSQVLLARDDLRFDALYVVYPGHQRFPLGDGVEAVLLWAVLPHAEPATIDMRSAGSTGAR